MQQAQSRESATQQPFRKTQSPPVTHSDVILFLILMVSVISLTLRLSRD